MKFDFLFQNRHLAGASLRLKNENIILQFEVYEEKFLKTNDPYAQMLRFLLNVGQDGNVFCFKDTGEFVWRVAMRPDIGRGNPFLWHLKIDSDGMIRTNTWTGHIYKIDPETGFLNLIDWTK